jgi:HemK-related putative methylase
MNDIRRAWSETVPSNSAWLQRVRSRIWRGWFKVRFLLFQRHRHNRVVLEIVAGRPILVLPTVMNPVLFLTGQYLAETLAAGAAGSLQPAAPGSVVLDLGAGSGVAAVFAAPWAGRVVAVDINPAAVRCTRINALLHGVEDKIEALHGDLFEPVAGRRFDLILFNPPYLPGTPRSVFERALRSQGLAERFAAELAGHLTGDGHALLLLSSIGDEAGWLEPLRRRGFSCQPVAQRNMISEMVTIYRVDPLQPA